jgi:HK97 family phage major capsid protein
MEDEEKKAAEKTAKLLADIKTIVETHTKQIKETGDELGEVKKGLTGEEYLKTADWKSKWEQIEAKFGEIDDELKNAYKKSVKMVDEKGGANEEQKKLAALAMKQIRYLGLQRFGSPHMAQFAPTAEDFEFMQKCGVDMSGQTVNIPSPGWQAKATKDLVSTNIVRAGALVTPPEMFNEIINQNVHEFSPMRPLSKIRQTSSNMLPVPAKTARGISYWVGEVATRTEDETLAFGMENIPLHEMALYVQVSQTMLEDSYFNLQGELESEYAEAQLVLEGTAFTTGNGIQKPQGILNHSGLSSRNQGEAAAITNLDAVMALQLDVKAKYLGKAVYMMKRATMGVLRAIKGGDGHYLNVIEKMPGTNKFTLDGIECVLNPDMPTVAAGVKPILFGDIGQAYTILDKIGGQRLIVDIYSNKTSGLVDVLFSKRVGGQPMNIEAVYALNIST